MTTIDRVSDRDIKEARLRYLTAERFLMSERGNMIQPIMIIVMKTLKAVMSPPMTPVRSVDMPIALHKLIMI